MHMPSDETEQYDGPETIVQREGGEGGESGEGVGKIRGPQSVQSVPRLHLENSDPGPPSLQTPLEAKVHVSVQVCALAKPTIWARKRMRASRGPKAHLTWTVLHSQAHTCSSLISLNLQKSPVYKTSYCINFASV
jgi:hypothetical protein